MYDPDHFKRTCSTERRSRSREPPDTVADPDEAPHECTLQVAMWLGPSGEHCSLGHADIRGLATEHLAHVAGNLEVLSGLHHEGPHR